ncbi:MAG: sigma-70 family RNA polymerase sigma factor [Planctomycetota bacterium]|nr:sigma-70 family RNA polymerase sigma factor [Planctomycetota bacterium]
MAGTGLTREEVEKLLVEWSGRLYSLAFNLLGNAADAEDAVQDAALAVVRSASQFRRGEPVGPWLHRIATNAAVSIARRRGARKEEAMSAEAIPCDGGAGKGVETAELCAAGRAALGTLPEDERLCVVLHYFQGIGYRDVARALGIPEGTANSRIARGRERLRARLEAFGSALAAMPLSAMDAAMKAAGNVPVPASLAGRLAAIAREGAAAPASSAADGTAGGDPADGGPAGTAGGANTTGAAGGGGAEGSGVSAAAKGGMTMRIMICAATALLMAAAGILVPEYIGWGKPPASGGSAGAKVTGGKVAGGGEAEKPPAGESKAAEGNPPAGPNDGKPAPVNPYNGMQEREEVFEFTQKPKVEKQGDKWVITFASKGKCDATVAILNRDGKIIRHLASGVLGPNAPYPFQQNSLSQRIEWDGLTDDFRKTDPSGCKVKVSLGLKPVFERNIWWDPYAIPDYLAWGKYGLFVGVAADGGRVVGGVAGSNCVAYVFDKDWKYVKTVYPPPASELEAFCAQRGIKMGTTKWGDKVPVIATTFWGGARPSHNSPADYLERYPDLVAAMIKLGGARDVKVVPLAEVGMPDHGLPVDPGVIVDKRKRPYIPLFDLDSNWRLAVDPHRDMLYIVPLLSNCGIIRIDGKTGAFDAAWTQKGRHVPTKEFDCGWDGLFYARCMGQPSSHWLIRLDVDANPVPFAHNAEIMAGARGLDRSGVPHGFPKDMTGIYTGVADKICNVHEKGFDVSVNGNIVTVVEMQPTNPQSGKFMRDNGLGDKKKGGWYVVVWDRDGRLLTANAIDGNLCGHGVRMDRDGNIYRAMGGILPPGAKSYDGITDVSLRDGWEGYKSIVKFRGQGGKAVGTLYCDARGGAFVSYKDNKDKIPADALKLQYNQSPAAAEGGLWVYGPISTDNPNGDGCCTCWHQREELDGWGRLWVPSIPCGAVMVLDSNGNRVMRAGRYGNVDDTEADVKAGRDGLRFACPKAVAVSDAAVYVHDLGNRRILKAALKYAAEETVPLP